MARSANRTEAAGKTIMTVTAITSVLALVLVTLFTSVTSIQALRAEPMSVPDDGLEVQAVTNPGEHTESPVWDWRNKGLLFVDIAGQSLHFYDPKRATVRSIGFDGPVSPVLPLADGSLAVGVGRELRWLDWASAGFNALPPAVWPAAVLARVEPSKPGNRFNDGNVDARGRLWIGTMGPEPTVGNVEPNQGSLYRVSLQGQTVDAGRTSAGLPAVEVQTVVTPVSISNGLTWDLADKHMYYIDTPTRRVDVFDFDLAAGTIANRRPAFDLAANNVTGNPDGMTIDSNGYLWVACFGGGQVIQVDPFSGRLLRAVPLPASQVTAVAFGPGADGDPGDTLYVTTMRRGLSEEQLLREPLAGAVFAVHGLRVRGARRGQTLFDE